MRVSSAAARIWYDGAMTSRSQERTAEETRAAPAAERRAEERRVFERRAPGGARRAVLRLVAAVTAAAAVVVAVFLGGFVVFAVAVSIADVPATPQADGIVALTGGRDRVAEAIDLLAAGRGRRLLISGVHPQTRAIDIEKQTESGHDVFACCVDLGRTALTTAGNAAEAADWVRTHGFSSLIVVTSAYHMPRSLIELERALPGVAKVPYPIARADLNLETWFLHPQTAKLLFREYVKYIVARFALSGPPKAATVVAGVGVGEGRRAILP